MDGGVPAWMPSVQLLVTYDVSVELCLNWSMMIGEFINLSIYVTFLSNCSCVVVYHYVLH